MKKKKKIIIFDCETVGIPGRSDMVQGKSSNSELVKNYFSKREGYIRSKETIISKGEPIQVAFAVCDYPSMNIEKLESFYCLPSEPITQGAFGVHGISNDEIVRLCPDKKSLEDYILGKYKDDFCYDNTIFVGYNVIFDIGCINRTLYNFNYSKISNSKTITQEDLVNSVIKFGDKIKSLNEAESFGNCYYDLMARSKSYFSYYKNPRLEEAIRLSGLGDKMEKLYKIILRRMGLNNEDKGSFHDARYDVVATWALLNILK
jgi:DNA polymerase III epsilon subunit-like protein